jgi:hypothetical protein
MVTALGLAERLKSGVVLLAFHAVKSALASTEPRPVTKLYPLEGSALEALNPKEPDEGHRYEAGILLGVPTLQKTMLLPLVTWWNALLDVVLLRL